MSSRVYHFLDFEAYLCLMVRLSGWTNLVLGICLLRENGLGQHGQGQEGRFYRILGWRKIECSMNFQMPVFSLGSRWLLQNHLGELAKNKDFLKEKKKNLPANAGDIRDTGSISGLGRSSGGGYDNPLQYSCLENPMDRGAGRLHSMGLQGVGYDWLTVG